MIRVAIVGAGIGRMHLEGYRELPDMFEVRTICDLDLKRAAEMVSEQETIALSDDIQAVLADPEIDLVDVCLPPQLHFDVTKAVLQAGKHAVCEKPLVRSVAEADVLIRIASQTGKQIFPVFQYRYGPATARLQALIDAGLAGKPLVATVETHWNRREDYYAVDWRGTWSGESGGAILGHAIHNHDLLCRFMGPVRNLSAMLDTRVNDIEVDDCAAISMRMENGALATSSVTLGSSEEISRLRFVYSGLTVESGTEPYTPAQGTWRYIARDPENQPRVDEVVASVCEVKCGFAGFFKAIGEALGGVPGNEVTLEDGRRSIELVTAIYQAARSGGQVSLPLGTASGLYRGWTP
ncbi:Gfo/Idh/MocA family oxidoreductase [Labrenzia sp. OB1]|uniref:Gfo/Idh/MocA family protein n=1 Tax=Labrenzia sp. OB1 TaxID=1561204 RepID=UPI0007B24593|nr:Gfo/Idh/MocA family oxidoreductase [Labrenzia sp. OB1]KZM48784.1 oxidoreductase [Labrenzia sp. OB1]